MVDNQHRERKVTLQWERKGRVDGGSRVETNWPAANLGSSLGAIRNVRAPTPQA